MSRYTRRRPKAWDYDEDEPFRPCLTVDEHVEVETGLVWADGEPIMRTPRPIGFGRDGEW